MKATTIGRWTGALALEIEDNSVHELLNQAIWYTSCNQHWRDDQQVTPEVINAIIRVIEHGVDNPEDDCFGKLIKRESLEDFLAGQAAIEYLQEVRDSLA